jgi:glucose-6-phosphate 1-epimerase
MVDGFSSLVGGDSFGGQLAQAQLSGFKIFYEAPLSLHVKGDPRRGGVPVLFPQFNNVGNFAKHGFARTMNWHLLAESKNTWAAQLNASSENVTPHLPLGSAPWPHNAQLTLTTETFANSLEVMLVVENTGDSTFSFAGGLHPYFAWNEGDAHIPELGIRLSRAQMLERGSGIEERVGCADQLTLAMRDYSLTIKRIGFKEWMLWNPGPSHTLKDIAPNDWQQFICLEPITLAHPHTLAPGQKFEGGFALTLKAAA